jgi:uncharacterized damage-inducible protein DinB
LLIHEIHHRAQVMAMTRLLGGTLENIDFGYLAFKRRVLSD